MCTPVIAALALTAAGSAATAAGVRRAQKAQAGAREAERIRQKSYQSEAEAAAAENLGKTGKDATEAGMAEAEQKRKTEAEAAVAEVRAPVEATGENLAGSNEAARLVAAENAAAAGRGLGFALQQGGAKAKLASFGDVNFANAIANARTNQDIARIANFAKGSADVLPVELEAAAQRGQGLRTLGNLLSTAGMVTGMGAGAGWWNSAPTNAATGLAPGFNATSSSIPSMGIGAGPYTPGWTTLPPSSLPPVQPLNLSLKLPSYVLR